MYMTRVLLIEDDRDLAETLLQLMQLAQMQPDYASNGKAGLNLAQNNTYDVLVVDIGLPQLDGLALCRQLRIDGIDTPVLFLTAYRSIDNKLQGFDAGGDDYLAKPFDNRELIARINALSGRRSNQVKRVIVGDLNMDCQNLKVTYQNTTLELSPTCYKLLETLMRASPSVVNRLTLENALWGDEPPNSNVLKAHICNLRRELTRVNAAALLHTLLGKGWALRAGKST